MIVRGCCVWMTVYLPDGSQVDRTSYVYGPSAEEYASVMAANDGVTYKIIKVENLRAYEEKGYVRRRRQAWEEPARHFFDPSLGKDPISGGAGADDQHPWKRGGGAFLGSYVGDPRRRTDHGDGDAQ